MNMVVARTATVTAAAATTTTSTTTTTTATAMTMMKMTQPAASQEAGGNRARHKDIWEDANDLPMIS
eukprot:scaffold679268_cov83-Prasinocladus_malaysianus.AAC.1